MKPEGVRNGRYQRQKDGIAVSIILSFGGKTETEKTLRLSVIFIADFFGKREKEDANEKRNFELIK